MRLSKAEAECLRKLDIHFRKDINLIKINLNNTLLHEKTKFMTFWFLRKKGKKVITEAIFKNGNRADVYNITDDEVYEIETDFKKGEERKKDKYPVAWTFIINPAKPIEKQM